jgi:hypothetical protein
LYGGVVTSCQLDPVVGSAAACLTALANASPESVAAGAVRSKSYWLS